MERSSRRSLAVWWPAVRWIPGVVLVAVSYSLWRSQPDLLDWRLFFFALGLLATWLGGPRWGWLIAPGYFLVDGAFRIAWATRGVLQWFYQCNVLSAAAGEADLLIGTMAFSLLASLGGLCGWGSALLIRRLVGRDESDWRGCTDALPRLVLVATCLGILLLIASCVIGPLICPLTNPPPPPPTSAPRGVRP